jgi:hypothetical protein
MPGGEDNPKGFYEHGHITSVHVGLLHMIGSFDLDFLPLNPGWERHPKVVAYHDYLLKVIREEFGQSPLWGFKDPRTCRLVPLWNGLFDAMGVKEHYVIVVRDPEAVAASMWKRENVPYEHSLLLWVIHMLEAEYHTRGRSRVVVGYDDILSDWRGQGQRIGKVLGIQWPACLEAAGPAAEKFIDGSLNHFKPWSPQANRIADLSGGADQRTIRWAADAYQTFAAGAADGESGLRLASLDAIRGEFMQALPRLLPLRPKPMKPRLERKYLGVAAMLDRPAAAR